MAFAEHYEQLRMRAVAGAGSGIDVGMALLRREGVAAWMERVLPGAAPDSRQATGLGRFAACQVTGEIDGHIVRVLANMALGRLGGTQ